MEIKSYLEKLINDIPNYSLSVYDNKTIQFEGIEEYIYRKLTSSKYRARSVGNYGDKVREKIHYSVKQKKPIHVSLPFGATKNPYLPTAPAIDWAEVFSLILLRDHLSPIAACYEHGVILEFVSVAVFEERVNRIPQKDSDLYHREFSKLLEHFHKLLPTGLQYSYSRVEDTISRKHIESALEKKIELLHGSWNEQSQKIRDYKMLRARRNMIYDPKKNQADDLVLDSALGHDAFCSECWTDESAPWDKELMITLGQNYTSGWAIHVRSAPASSVNFWSGIGTLEDRKTKYVPTILSFQQYDKLKSKINNIDIELFTDSFTNLNSIPVLNKP